MQQNSSKYFIITVTCCHGITYERDKGFIGEEKWEKALERDGPTEEGHPSRSIAGSLSKDGPTTLSLGLLVPPCTNVFSLSSP
jgi:hypothetical protein